MLSGVIITGGEYGETHAATASVEVYNPRTQNSCSGRILSVSSLITVLSELI